MIKVIEFHEFPTGYGVLKQYLVVEETTEARQHRTRKARK
jgi:hypothetical protein